MDLFTQLFIELDQTNKTAAKSKLLSDYFKQANPADAAWAIYFLMGERMKRLVKTADLKQWACELSHYPEWLFAECYDHVGDLAETLALCIFSEDKFRKAPLKMSLSELIENYLLPMKTMEPEAQSQIIIDLWSRISAIASQPFEASNTGDSLIINLSMDGIHFSRASLRSAVGFKRKSTPFISIKS